MVLLLTVKTRCSIMNGGTIRNSGINGTSIKISRASQYVSGGKLTLTDGTIENTNTTSGRSINVQGALIMRGGEIKQANNGAAAIENNKGDSIPVKCAVIAISGGAIMQTTQLFALPDGSEKPTISGGVFSQPVGEYLTGNSAAISYTAKGGNPVYAVGASISEVTKQAKAGDTITVLQGDTILQLDDQVAVTNAGEGNVSVNGVTVEPSESIISHNYETKWTFNQTHHWHACTTCDEISEKGPHTFGSWIITKPAAAAETGSQEKVCSICGYKVTESIAATGTDTITSSSDHPSQDQKDHLKSEDKDTSAPSTGDNSNLLLWLALLLISGTTLGIVIRSKNEH